MKLFEYYFRCWYGSKLVQREISKLEISWNSYEMLHVSSEQCFIKIKLLILNEPKTGVVSFWQWTHHFPDRESVTTAAVPFPIEVLRVYHWFWLSENRSTASQSYTLSFYKTLSSLLTQSPAFHQTRSFCLLLWGSSKVMVSPLSCFPSADSCRRWGARKGKYGIASSRNRGGELSFK